LSRWFCKKLNGPVAQARERRAFGHCAAFSRQRGLYTATQQKDGSWKVSKSKITADQYKALKARFGQLDNNGETKKEAEKRRKENEKNMQNHQIDG
jgi:hypothetical protein